MAAVGCFGRETVTPAGNPTAADESPDVTTDAR
jgi:hypothetical protein